MQKGISEILVQASSGQTINDKIFCPNEGKYV